MRVIALLMILFTSGCATTTVTSSDSFKLSVGQSKADVLEILGEPQRNSASSDGEIFEYDIKGKSYQSCLAVTGFLTVGLGSGECNDELDVLVVIFVNGRLSSYEQMVDSDYKWRN